MLNIYNVPDCGIFSDSFICEINGEYAPVRKCFVSAIPYNRRWPGHQRTKDQAEEAYFVSFEADGCVTLKIKAERKFEKAVVRPLSKNIDLSVSGEYITFFLTEPGGYSLELDGYHNNLHIFFDPPQTKFADMNNPDTIYFGAGIHEIGTLQLRSNQTVYIDEGATVYGSIHAFDCDNIKILGRGVLDNSKNKETILFEIDELGDGHTDVRNSKREPTVYLVRCNNIELDGFTIYDSLAYNVGMWGCENIEINNLKIIGCWRYNSDGIDFHNCKNGHVSNCFIRTFDDTICFKGHVGFPDYCENIFVEKCVVWCDWDHCLEIGAECCANYMRNLTFCNIDIIRSLDIAMNIGNVDYGTVSDIVFEDIRIEYDRINNRPQIQQTDDQPYEYAVDDSHMPLLMSTSINMHHEYSEGRIERGHINGVTFRNIHVYAHCMPPSSFGGYDEKHMAENLMIDGLYFNGKKLTRDEANIIIRKFASVSFSEI